MFIKKLNIIYYYQKVIAYRIRLNRVKVNFYQLKTKILIKPNISFQLLFRIVLRKTLKMCKSHKGGRAPSTNSLSLHQNTNFSNCNILLKCNCFGVFKLDNRII